MKVIASSLRKGNIVDIDGKLGVIVTIESIHPGKGTPVTQMDVRRIADGVKVALRYKTTDQVERAFVEDNKFQFMYQDGEGFHFMNMENYEQVALNEDIIGDQAAYLHPEMEVTISLQQTEQHIHICIRDNGKGFEPADSSTFGNGLKNMKERLGQIGGTCGIGTNIGKGTTVNFYLPFFCDIK